jgi:hypothetical protein
MNTATDAVSTSNIGTSAPPVSIGSLPYSEILRRAKLEDQRQIEQARFEAQRQEAEASSARVAQVTVLKGRIDELCEQWQEHRAALRATFAQLWEAEEALGTVTGGQVHYMPRGLLKAHIPSAKPAPADSVWGSGFSSCEEDMQAWIASGRKVWPTK